MDEEDLREAEEARTLQTSESFAGFTAVGNSSRSDALVDIFRPSGETAGEKLLKRMGWKDGQGIGPRLRREADLGEGQRSKDQSHTFAPPDVPVLALAQKTDRKGLGFDDVDTSARTKFGSTPNSDRATGPPENDEGNVSSTETVLPFGVRGAISHRRGGFGVGVLNDTGSDEEDPYSMGPKISYNKTIGGDKVRRKERKKPTVNPSVHSKPVLLSRKVGDLQSALRKCHDGKLPMDGFILGDQVDNSAFPSSKKDAHRPPDVPSGWISKIAPVSAVQDATTDPSAGNIAKPELHTSKSRAAALGEASLPGKSVFDYLSSASRDRLAAASGNSNLPAGLGEVPTGYERAKVNRPELQDLIPSLDEHVALQALSRSSDAAGSWMPYSEDLEKRDRYQLFLEIKAGLRPDELPTRADGLSQTGWMHEMNEFARAAEVFKPMSGLMANRFTSSGSSATQTQEPQSSDTNTLITYKRNKPEDPAEAAAKMGMFGQMTRSTSRFYPTRLLCKRFGVPMPDMDNGLPPQDTAAPLRRDGVSNANRFQSAGYQEREMPESRQGLTNQSPAHADVAISVTTGAPPVQLQRVDPERNEVLEQNRPGMALFKSIFGSDDEDDD